MLFYHKKSQDKGNNDQGAGKLIPEITLFKHILHD